MEKDLFWDWEDKKSENSAINEQTYAAKELENHQMGEFETYDDANVETMEVEEIHDFDDGQYGSEQDLEADEDYQDEIEDYEEEFDEDPEFEEVVQTEAKKSTARKFAVDLVNPYENETEVVVEEEVAKPVRQPHFTFETTELDPQGFLEINQRLMEQMNNLNIALENTFHAMSNDLEYQREKIQNQKEHIDVTTELQRQVYDKQQELHQLKQQEQELQERVRQAQINKEQIEAAAIATAIESAKKAQEEIKKTEEKPKVIYVEKKQPQVVEVVRPEPQVQPQQQVVQPAPAPIVNSTNIPQQPVTQVLNQTTSLPKIDNSRQLQFQTANINNQAKKTKLKKKGKKAKVFFWILFWFIVLAAIGMLIFWLLEFLDVIDLVDWPGFNKPN